MKKDFIYANTQELPLENIALDGGYCAIFRTVCCIGDSLSSGEFEIKHPDGTKTYHDIYEQSWGQYIARKTGAKVYNFSRGGLTAREFLEAYAPAFDCYNREKVCQAYIIALGVNDLICRDTPIGSTEDFLNGSFNKETFAGQMGEIVFRFRALSPDAKFFFVTMPKDSNDKRTVSQQEKHSALLYDMARVLPNSYVIDLRKYGPEYDERFKEIYYLEGHLAPMGYKLTTDLIAGYIDYIIRHNPSDFKLAGMINQKV